MNTLCAAIYLANTFFSIRVAKTNKQTNTKTNLLSAWKDRHTFHFRGMWTLALCQLLVHRELDHLSCQQNVIITLLTLCCLNIVSKNNNYSVLMGKATALYRVWNKSDSLRVQWDGTCWGIPSKVKHNLLHLTPLRTKERGPASDGLVWIPEAAYSWFGVLLWPIYWWLKKLVLVVSEEQKALQ